MASPVVTDTAIELYQALGPHYRKAEERGAEIDRWELMELCESIMGRLDPVEIVIRDTDDGPGWSIVMDPDRAPSLWLPWDAQFGGVRVLIGLSDADQRIRIKNTDGMRRGSPGAIVSAAQSVLTGAKTVYLVERHGSAYRLTVAAKTSETPNLDALTRAVVAQKPGALVMAVVTVVGDDYDTLRDTHTSYDDVLSTYTSYSDILTDPSR